MIPVYKEIKSSIRSTKYTIYPYWSRGIQIRKLSINNMKANLSGGCFHTWTHNDLYLENQITKKL